MSSISWGGSVDQPLPSWEIWQSLYCLSWVCPSVSITMTHQGKGWESPVLRAWGHCWGLTLKGDGSPVFMSHISWIWKPPLSHSSPHHGWFYLIFLFLSQQKAFYLFTYLFYLFFKLRQGGGWDLHVKSKRVRRGWAGLVRGIFSYISLRKLRRKEGKSLCNATP